MSRPTLAHSTYLGAGSASFQHYLRHEFVVAQEGKLISATGLRLKVSSNQIAMDGL